MSEEEDLLRLWEEEGPSEKVRKEDWKRIAEIIPDEFIRQQMRQRVKRTLKDSGIDYLVEADKALSELEKKYRDFWFTAYCVCIDVIGNLGGKEIPTGEMKRELVERIRKLCKVYVICPKCQRPAVLRYSKSGSSPSGVFQFAHWDEKTVHGGTTKIPKGIEFSEPVEEFAEQVLGIKIPKNWEQIWGHKKEDEK